MKKVYTFGLILLLCVCAFFTSCGGNAGLSNNPATGATVYGNGGIAVTKGEYLYFVNGYEDASAFTSYITNNVDGKVERSAIYRTKLNANGNVVRDENGFLENCDLVVSKTVGFNNGGFYIVGDYIYYLTPHMENDESGKLQKDWIDVCKINIDGSGKATRLYYTQNSTPDFQWGAYLIDGKTFITLLDGTNLISINASNNSHVVLAENVTSVAFAQYSEYKYENVCSYDNYLYYTRAKVDSDSVSSSFAGNIVCKVNITNKEDNATYIGDLYDTYKIVKYSLGEVYYEKTSSKINKTLLYKKNISSNAFDSVSEVQLTTGVYSDYLFADLEQNSLTTTYTVGVDANKVVFVITKNSTNSSDPISSKLYTGSDTITLLTITNNKVYFVESSKIYSLSILNGEVTPTLITNSTKTYKTDVENLISVVDNKVYVLAQYTADDSEDNHYYLNQITTTLSSDETQFLGKFVSGEVPTNPNDDLGEGDEAILPWLK